LSWRKLAHLTHTLWHLAGALSTDLSDITMPDCSPFYGFRLLPQSNFGSRPYLG